MMKIVVSIIILLVVGLAAYMLLKPGSLNNIIPGQTPSKQGATLPKEVEVPLDTQNNSNELGTATLQKVNGKLMVRITLKGQPAGVAQPAHIHLGSCPNPGVVKYPLTPVADGLSETVLDTSGDDLPGLLPLAVNVHMSDQDMKTYVACGDVKL